MAEDSAGARGYALDDSPAHLLRRAQQRAAELFAAHAVDDSLTQRQFVVLYAVAEHEGVSQTELVRLTGVDRSTLADMVARLVKRGLLARERAKSDARANAVTLTGAGRDALIAASPGAQAADAEFLSSLSKDKRADLIALLRACAEEPPEDDTAEDSPSGDGKKKKKKKKGKGKKGKD